MDIAIVAELLEDSAHIEEVADHAGCTYTRASLETVDSADVCAIPVQGSERVTTAVESAISTPLLPIETKSGIGSVSIHETREAISAISNGDYATVERSALTIEQQETDVEIALFEVLFVTEEPAAISEFSIGTPQGTIAEYRADGVIVATAAGSSGYARRVGSPMLSPEVPGASVTTIAPYKIDPDHWVIGDPGIRIEVTRDESNVIMLADEKEIGTITPKQPVFLKLDRRFRTVTVPQSTSVFERHRQ